MRTVGVDACSNHQTDLSLRPASCAGKHCLNIGWTVSPELREILPARSSPAGRRCDGDAAAVMVCDLLHQTKTQAGTGGARPQPMKRLEYALTFLLRNAGTVILDLQRGPVDPYDDLFTAMFDRVLYEICQRALDRSGVAHNHSELLNDHLDCLARRDQHRREIGSDAARDSREIDPFARHAVVQSVKIEQLLREGRKPGHIRQKQTYAFVFRGVDLHPQYRDRRSQLVGCRCDEAVLAVIAFIKATKSFIDSANERSDLTRNLVFREPDTAALGVDPVRLLCGLDDAGQGA